MAKQIKTIKCPQCGSTQKTELGDDRYRCNSCGAEYFLDNDDVNVNVRHTFDNFGLGGLIPNLNWRKLIKWFIVFNIIVVFFPLIISSIFVNSCGSSSSTTTKTIADAVESEYKYTVSESTPVIIKGKAYLACFGERRSNSGLRTSKKVYFFYEVSSGKIVGTTAVDMLSDRNVTMRRFADGSCYLSINKTYLFKLNKDKMRFEDYLPYIRQASEEFSSGVATINIANSIYGEAFDIMSNDGGEYKYYPIVNKLYTEKEADIAARGKDGLLPGARDSVIYLFTDDIFPPVKLMEATLKYNAGGPMDTWLIERFTYSSSFFYSGSKIVESHDVTPGHHWFDAHVAYYGHNDLLVSARATPAEDAQITIQKIDTGTGKVLWNTPVNTSTERRAFTYFDESIKVGNLYIIKDDRRNYLLIDNNGKLIKGINLNDL